MKKLIIWLICFLTFNSACKKEKPATPVSDTEYTDVTNALAGKWYWEKTEHYEGGIIDSVHDSLSDPDLAGGYIDFKSDFYGILTEPYNPYHGPLYYLYYGNNLSPSNPPTYWGVQCIETSSGQSLKYLYGFNCYIKTLNSSSLVFSQVSEDTPTFGMKYYYHR